MSLNFGQIPSLTTELSSLEHLKLHLHQVSSAIFIQIFLILADNHTGKSICRFAGIYAYCRYFIDIGVKSYIEKHAICLKYYRIRLFLSISMHMAIYVSI